jgi:hypothetical protein
MRKNLLFVLIGLMCCLDATAQDYFADRNEAGIPVLLTTEGKRTALFSANLNLADASTFKANFYQQYMLDEKPGNIAGNPPLIQNSLGWGINGKAKTQNSVGNLFKSGEFKPGVGFGGYLAYSHYNYQDKCAANAVFSTWSLILSGNVDYSQHMFFYPTAAYKDQLAENTFRAPQATLSFVKFLGPKTDNFIIGFSAAVAKKSNYDELDTYEIKPDSVILGTNMSRHVSKINDNGNTYASGDYKEYTNYRLKANLTYIPSALDYKIGFSVYPWIDLSSSGGTKYNTGIAFHLLKEGSPSTSQAAVFVEFGDLSNSANSAKPFIKRSFKFGVSTSLNFISL